MKADEEERMKETRAKGKKKDLDFEHGCSVKVADVFEDHGVIISEADVQKGLACVRVYFLGEVRVGFELLDESAPVALAYQFIHYLEATFYWLGLSLMFW